MQVPVVVLVSPTASLGGDVVAEEVVEGTRSIVPEVSWQPQPIQMASPVASSVMESFVAPEEQLHLRLLQDGASHVLDQGVSRGAKEYDFRSEDADAVDHADESSAADASQIALTKELNLQLAGATFQGYDFRSEDADAVDITDDVPTANASHISSTKELHQQLALSNLTPQDFQLDLTMPSTERTASSIGDECPSARSSALPQDQGPLPTSVPLPSGCPTASLVDESQGSTRGSKDHGPLPISVPLPSGCPTASLVGEPQRSTPASKESTHGFDLSTSLLAPGSARGSASEVRTSAVPSRSCSHDPSEAPGPAAGAGAKSWPLASAGGGKSFASPTRQRDENYRAGLLSPPMTTGSTLAARGLGRFGSKDIPGRGSRGSKVNVAAPSKERLEPLAESPKTPAKQCVEPFAEEAEEKTKNEATEKAEREAEAKARMEAEETAKREARRRLAEDVTVGFDLSNPQELTVDVSLADGRRSSLSLTGLDAPRSACASEVEVSEICSRSCSIDSSEGSAARMRPPPAPGR